MKIRTYLLILLLALVVPLVAFMGHNIVTDQQAAVAQAQQMLASQAAVMATNLGTKLRNARYRLEYLATLPPEHLFDLRRCDASLPALLAMHPEYANIVATDLQGTSLCSAVPPPPGKPTSVGSQPWFQRFLKERRFQLGEPFFGPIVKKTVLVLTQPVFDRRLSEPVLLGSINITIAIDAFDPQLPAEHLPAGMRYGFLNTDGVLMWRNVDAGELGKPLLSEAGLKVVTTRDGLFKARASDQLDRYYAVKSLPEFGLVAFVSIPTEVVHAEPHRSALLTTLASAIAIALLVLIALRVARRIADPVIALERATMAIHAGDTTAWAPETGPREIAGVARAFNQLHAARQDAEDELQRQADALRESEERFRHLFEDTHQAITIVEDGHFIAANRASLALLGYDRLEDFLGRTPVDISPEFQPDGQSSAAQAAVITETAIRQGSHLFEWVHLRADGTPFTAEILLTAIHQGEKILLHVVWRDITAHKKAEAELAAYRDNLETMVEARTNELEAIFNTASSGIVFVRDRKVLRCNRTMEQLFGYAHGEMTGQTTRNWYSDDATYDEIGRNIVAAFTATGLYREERELVRKDGSRFWGRMTAQPLDRAQLSKGLVGMIEDITSERAASHALVLANEEQQAILDTATIGIALIRDRVFLRCNARLHQMLGWPNGTMLGQPTAIWYKDEADNIAGGESVYARIWQGESHTRELQLLRKDGSLFWARLTGCAVDIHDHDKGTVWVVEDITAERNVLEEMRKARELAEDAARMKSDFVANMSHEIRTPMNAVIGMTHLVLKTELNDKQRDYLKKIQGSSQHLLGIINDILDFSKIEAGKLVVEHIRFELEKVLDNVAGLIVEKTAAKGLELLIDVSPDVPASLVGDPLRIGQILINYANNAVKFTDHGEITIRVERSHTIGDEVVLRFLVTDTGIGIAEEQRSRLFRSFEQADTSTTRKYGGTGLGLAISKRLAALMHGEVGVDSEPGKGSSFWFTARLGVAEHAGRQLLPDPDLRGRPVLVVDDNEHARGILAEMLRNMSFSVATVDSGQAAVAEILRGAAAGKPYELVLLDWQMSHMDGIDTSRAIAALDLPVQPHRIIITAYGRDDLMKAAEQAGIEDVLIKPVSASLLFDTLMRLFRGQRAAPGEEARSPASVQANEVAAGTRVLLVEDNDLNQEVARELLVAGGCVVDIAADGAIAVRQVQAQPYDIVLMDMQMPVMDGIEATLAIRALPGFDKLPIVAMTANAMTSDRDRCLAAGMNDHIAKPIDPDALWQTLRRWLPAATENLGNGRTASTPAAPAPAPETQVVAQLAAVPGLDVSIGLRMIMGREKLYLSLLDKLITGQRDFSRRLSEAVAAGDHRAAERIAHTLKGAAAQVGALQVRDAAEQLELLLRRSAPAEEISTHIAETCRQVDELLAAVTPLLPNALPQHTPAELDAKRLRDICQELAGRLAADDFNCQQLLQTHAELLRTGLGDQYPWIVEAVESFNYSAALDWLNEALAKLPHPS